MKYGVWIFEGVEYFWLKKDVSFKEAIDVSKDYLNKWPNDQVRIYEMRNGRSGKQVNISHSAA